jgi:adenylate cyclase
MYAPIQAKRGLSPVEISFPSSLWIAVKREMSRKAREAPKRWSHGVMKRSLEEWLFANERFSDLTKGTMMFKGIG